MSRRVHERGQRRPLEAAGLAEDDDDDVYYPKGRRPREYEDDDDDVYDDITQRGESQGKTKKERKATKSKGRGLEEGG